MDANGLAYCSYGQSYTLTDRKLCDASGLPTAQYTACDNLQNPCNSTAAFPIRCVGADNGWTCFCEITQTLGRDCGNLGNEKLYPVSVFRFFYKEEFLFRFLSTWFYTLSK